MEFLDEQGVQPCGHKAREKGILIKVIVSCKSNEIPTEYCFYVDGMGNDNKTGVMVYWKVEPFLKTQTTDHIDSSELRCGSQTIDNPCMLPPDLTWRRLEEMRKKPSDSVMTLDSGLISKLNT